ncbi:DUF6515 family protein [Cellulophaga fucicola]|uniref:Orphan protein n=1 Tax=Cellulophaga fucicola TaxID=76595 RepID=A0A1K1MD63_9FLAO|nr:DUF6515 family protein [Cellulophaga fucicola]SFW21090.1 hypothetical protein SAMN05660313_00523 [Cellulophaga fucicola]
MKKLIKKYIVPITLLVAFTTQVSAQRKRTTKEKTVVTTTTTRSTTSRRVPSTKVTYRTPKKKVVSVRTVPNRTVIKHRGQDYYYANNRFYTQSRGRYIVIAPKVGFRIKVLPTNYKRVRFNNHTYFNVQGIFYSEVNNEYEVVDPEVGTIVYELPDDYEKVTLDGQSYYEYANVLYEKVQVNGTRAYEVVGIIDMN